MLLCVFESKKAGAPPWEPPPGDSAGPGGRALAVPIRILERYHFFKFELLEMEERGDWAEERGRVLLGELSG